MTYASRPQACSGCPANSSALGFVPPVTPLNSRLIFIGLSPGEEDAWNSKPFYPTTPIGNRLDKWLHHSGISRTQISIGNLIQCWLPAYRRKGVPSGIREPSSAELKWCWNAHVGPWLLTGEALIKVPVGVPATKFLMGIPKDKGAEKFLGTLNDVQFPPIRENLSAKQ